MVRKCWKVFKVFYSSSGFGYGGGAGEANAPSHFLYSRQDLTPWLCKMQHLVTQFEKFSHGTRPQTSSKLEIFYPKKAFHIQHHAGKYILL